MNYQVFMLSYQHNGLKKYYGDCYMELYRFRSCDKLLGDKYKELEEQYFYFAPPSDQNDPMEGKIEFYWQGDKIACFGLLKNYVWQLFLTIVYVPAYKNIDEMEEFNFFVAGFAWKDSHYAESRTRLERNTINAPTLQKFVDAIVAADKKIEAASLQYLLTLIHPVAIDIVTHELVLIKYYDIDPQKTGAIFQRNNPVIEDNFTSYLQEKEKLQKDSLSWLLFLQQAKLIIPQNLQDATKKLAIQKRTFVQYEYPCAYIQKLQPKLCFANWYFTCFNTAIQNPATWAYYADSHKGVGLIFDTETDFCFDFKEHKNVKLDLTQVAYDKTTISRNFFESIGEVAGSEISHWFYIDKEVSAVWNKVQKNANAWHNQYWDDQKRSLSRKGEFWKHEEEYRILLSDMEKELTENSDRKLHYKFNILKGIVFGIRTPFEDKKKIVDILNRKCKENNQKNFPVYQAQYDKSGNYIEKVLFMTLPYDE